MSFAVVFAAVALIARTWNMNLLGWLLHILIDIPTHSFQYYATRFFWPIADSRFNGVAWWTPWVLISTYGVLILVYFVFWKKGWLPSLKLSRWARMVATGTASEAAPNQHGKRLAPAARPIDDEPA